VMEVGIDLDIHPHQHCSSNQTILATTHHFPLITRSTMSHSPQATYE
jgi:hypothetical protein